jgi:hypothetical protein
MPFLSAAANCILPAVLFRLLQEVEKVNAHRERPKILSMSFAG